MKALFLAPLVFALAMVPALAHDPDPNTPQGERVAMFKKSGSGIQDVFKVHIPNGNLAAISAFANEMARWGERMTTLFPEGSSGEGANNEIWSNWEDFEDKADRFTAAAEELSVAAASGDLGASKAAAQNLGASCKSCHESYRIKH